MPRMTDTERLRLDQEIDRTARKAAMARIGNSEWCKAMDEAQECVHREARDLP